MTSTLKAFEAKYPGKCSVCSGPIRGHLGKPGRGLGDRVVWNRLTKGQIAHASCYESHGRSFLPSAESFIARHIPTITDTNNQPLFQDPPETHETLTNETENTEMSSANAQQSSDLASIIAQAIAPHVQSKLDVEQVQAMIDSAIAKVQQSRIDETQIAKLIQKHSAIRVQVFSHENTEIQDVGRQHRQFPQLLELMNARDVKGGRLNFWLAGPAGTGKTTAAELVAKALSFPRCVVLPKLNDSSMFFGYNSPGTGKYLRTQARDVWEHGGMLVLDDFDGTDPNTATELMAPFANHTCMFPDAMVPRHKDCCIIVTANTFGHGGTEDYVGRLKQDKAFLNRFVKVRWDIDENLERDTCGNPQWAERVQSVRGKVRTKGIKVLITPRQSYYGAALLASGMKRDDVENIVLANEMTSEQWEQVR